MSDKNHVIREIPVYLSKCLSEKLTIIQYPQRPATVSMDGLNILQTKIKPVQKRLQMVIELDTEAETYDPETAELLGEAAEGIGLNEDEYMPEGKEVRIDKMTLEATEVPKLTESSRYVIGLIRAGQVTLVPLKSILQMKTVLPYLNKAEKARAAYDKNKTGIGESEEEAEDTEATKVTVKFSRNTASSGGREKASSRITSYAARRKEEEEPWVDLSYELDDPAEYEKLYLTNSENAKPFYILKQGNYLKLLLPKHVETSIEGANDKKAVNPKISIEQMRQMSLAEQLKVLLVNAKVIQYRQVVDFLQTKLRTEFDDTSLLRSIQTVGILVQGCWVVKSDIIYPEDFKSGANGISGAIMRQSRDSILSQFIDKRFVERRKMAGLTRLPTEEVTEILKQVAKMVPKQGWEFLLPYDSDFVSRFPDVIQRQTMIWEMKNQKRTRRSSSMSSPSRRHSRKSISSEGESGPEAEGHSRRRKSIDTSGNHKRRTPSRSENVGSTKVET